MYVYYYPWHNYLEFSFILMYMYGNILQCTMEHLHVVKPKLYQGYH